MNMSETGPATGTDSGMFSSNPISSAEAETINAHTSDQRVEEENSVGAMSESLEESKQESDVNQNTESDLIATNKNDTVINTDKKSSSVEGESESAQGNKRSSEEDGGSSPKKPNLEKMKSDEEYRNRKAKQQEERIRMQVLVSNFTEDQLNRYEMYRRAAFPKAALKRIMQSITGSALSQNVVIAMSGITKVFVGEVVEAALDVKEEWKETGPIQPKHLREAVRRLKHQGCIPSTKSKKVFFR